MTFFEFCKDLIDSAKERVKSPITSTFTIFFIIYNWRPIAMLLYSKKSIESTIRDINTDHFKWDSFAIPLFYTALYCIVLPYLSVVYEEYLFKPSKKRRTTSNNSRIDIVENKILLADAELRLQDKLSRNQEKQELLDKIEEMVKQRDLDVKASATVNETYQSQINELTKQLRQANSLLNNKVNSPEYERDLLVIDFVNANDLQENHIVELAGIPLKDDIVINDMLDAKTIKMLDFNGMIYQINNEIILNNKGLALLKSLVNMYSKYNSIQEFLNYCKMYPGY